jgi:hypothetical protein
MSEGCSTAKDRGEVDKVMRVIRRAWVMTAVVARRRVVG